MFCFCQGRPAEIAVRVSALFRAWATLYIHSEVTLDTCKYRFLQGEVAGGVLLPIMPPVCGTMSQLGRMYY